ncbi:MAG TPA: hypothetical protein VIB07_06805 [Nitrososphaera sp.]|jgi:hypothetical protein
MEIIESILWFSAGLLPTLAVLEGVRGLSRTPAAKVPVMMNGRGEVKVVYA